MGELQAELNRLAGTVQVDMAGAANIYAGTTGLELLGALNVKAGTVGLGLNAVLNKLAGTTGLDSQAAAALITTFTPNSIANLTAWYQADALSLTDGSLVSTWADSTGHGNTITASGSLRPTYIVRAQGGLPAVEFHGSNSLSGAFTLSQPLTLVAVVSDSSGGVTDILDGHTLNTMVLQKGANFLIYAGGFVVGTGGVDPNCHIHTAIFNGASSALWRDGGSGITGNAGGATPGGFTVGSGAGASSPMSGDVSEVLLYSRALSVNEINSVGKFLASKYGLTWTTAS